MRTTQTILTAASGTKSLKRLKRKRVKGERLKRKRGKEERFKRKSVKERILTWQILKNLILKKLKETSGRKAGKGVSTAVRQALASLML